MHFTLKIPPKNVVRLLSCICGLSADKNCRLCIKMFVVRRKAITYVGSKTGGPEEKLEGPGPPWPQRRTAPGRRSVYFRTISASSSVCVPTLMPSSVLPLLLVLVGHWLLPFDIRFLASSIRLFNRVGQDNCISARMSINASLSMSRGVQMNACQ